MFPNDSSPSFTKLESLSSSQLEDLLRSLGEDPDSNNEEAILDILSILNNRSKREPIDIDEKATSEAWNNFVNHFATSDGVGQSLFPVHTPETKIKKPMYKKRRILSRIVTVAAVLCILFTAIPSALGSDTFLDLLGRWKDGFFAFLQNEDEPINPAINNRFETSNPGLQQLYTKIVEHGVTKPVIPMWLPDGFIMTSCEKSYNPRKTSIAASFLNSSSSVVIEIEIYTQNKSDFYHVDDLEAETFELGGTTYYLISNNNNWVAVWADDNYKCAITTTLEKETLISIIKSIYKTGE